MLSQEMLKLSPVSLYIDGAELGFCCISHQYCYSGILHQPSLQKTEDSMPIDPFGFCCFVFSLWKETKRVISCFQVWAKLTKKKKRSSINREMLRDCKWMDGRAFFSNVIAQLFWQNPSCRVGYGFSFCRWRCRTLGSQTTIHLSGHSV